MSLSRRQFIAGCIGCSASIAALSGGRITGIAFGAPQDATEDILISVFLRGGIDGLNLVVPYNDPDYASNRPRIRIKAPGQTRGALDLNGFFGLHPSAQPLKDLYSANALAIVNATGLPDPTRSHFDAMAMMEKGTPGSKSVSTGWVARHLLSSTGAGGPIPALSAGGGVIGSLSGFPNTASMASVGDFEYQGAWGQIDFQRLSLRQMYTGSHWIMQAGENALNTVDRIAAANPGNYTPQFGATYPQSSFGSSLQVIAQLIKTGTGLRAASVDIGGWDTHESQGDDGQGFFSTQVQTLAAGLHAFYTDLTDYTARLTVVLMSEFGRRVQENQSAGTDHGHGNFMFVIGGNVNGGLYGNWPGLKTQQLDEGKDLAITTDYRTVLQEVVMRRLKNPKLGVVFPNSPEYKPLGLVKGQDQPIKPAEPGDPGGPGDVQIGPGKVYLPVSRK